MADANTDTKQIKKDMWHAIEKSPFLMVAPLDGSEHGEPLTAQMDKDQVDTLFFFVNRDNRIAGKDRLLVQFASKGHDFFASFRGRGRIDDDRALIEKLWNKQAEAWFEGGKDDPNLALLRIDIDDAELWKTDMAVTGLIKMFFGGTIKPSEEGSHAMVQTTAEGSDD